jgi:hypothetical protein
MRGEAEVIECQLCKHKALSSNPNLTKKKKKRERERSNETLINLKSPEHGQALKDGKEIQLMNM